MTNESCCSTPRTADGRAAHECPVTGTTGTPVDWLTVAALTEGRLPPRQEFRLCVEPTCEVVYFGSLGDTIPIERLSVAPAFKERGDDVICYCFLHTRSEIVDDLTRSGSTGLLESIRAEVAAGNCACEVRNPSGKCCLLEVRRTIAAVEAELASEVER